MGSKKKPQYQHPAAQEKKSNETNKNLRRRKKEKGRKKGQKLDWLFPQGVFHTNLTKPRQQGKKNQREQKGRPNGQKTASPILSLQASSGSGKGDPGSGFFGGGERLRVGGEGEKVQGGGLGSRAVWSQRGGGCGGVHPETIKRNRRQVQEGQKLSHQPSQKLIRCHAGKLKRQKVGDVLQEGGGQGKGPKVPH